MIDVCTDCPERKDCKTPCHAVNRLADGNKPLRERLLDINHDRYANKDYKAVLIEAQEAIQVRRTITIASIRTIEDKRRRLIAAGIYAQLTVLEIAEMLGFTKQWIYEILRED